MKRAAARLAALGLLGAALATACRPDDQSTRSVDTDAGQRTRAELPAELVAHLDSGPATSTARRSPWTRA